MRSEDRSSYTRNKLSFAPLECRCSRNSHRVVRVFPFFFFSSFLPNDRQALNEQRLINNRYRLTFSEDHFNRRRFYVQRYFSILQLWTAAPYLLFFFFIFLCFNRTRRRPFLGSPYPLTFNYTPIFFFL